jgi:hypothetical protein
MDLDAGEIDPTEYPSHFDDHLLSKMITELGRQIFTPTEIARRYGITVEQLFYILKRPMVIARVKREKALWTADEFGPDALRHKARVCLDETLPFIAAASTDKTLSPIQRLENARLMTRIAGLDGIPAGQGQGGGATTAPVSITFTLGDGRVEKFTTVVDGAHDALTAS